MVDREIFSRRLATLQLGLHLVRSHAGLLLDGCGASGPAHVDACRYCLLEAPDLAWGSAELIPADPALDEADKLHRAAERLGKLRLRQPPFLAQVGDPLAESFLKHGA